jgi:toll-like receptor 13
MISASVLCFLCAVTISVHVTGVSAVLDIAPYIGWDPCKISSETDDFLDDSESHNIFRPPSCVDYVPDAAQTRHDDDDHTSTTQSVFRIRPNNPAFACSRGEDNLCWCNVCKTTPTTELGQVTGYAKCECKNPRVRHMTKTHAACTPKLPSFVQVLSFHTALFEVIDNVSLKNVSGLNITSLVLAESLLQRIKRGALKDMTHLSCVNLDYIVTPFDSDTMLEIHNLPNLQRLSLGGYTGFNINDKYFQNPSFLSVQLWLRGAASNFAENDIHTERLQRLFKLFRNVSGLSLSSNKVQNVDQLLETLRSFELETDVIGHVERLDLSDNDINNVELSKFLGKPFELEALDLSANKLNNLQGFGSLVVPKLKQLNLYGNRIAGFDFTDDQDFPIITHDELRYLNLDGQMEAGEGKLNADVRIFDHVSLEELWLNTKCSRTITYSGKRWAGPRVPKENAHLQHLYVDGSDVDFTDERRFLEIFGHLTALRTLSMACSKLDFVSAQLFGRFANLTTLVLKLNAIAVLPAGVFDLLSQLTSLDLSGNQITVVSEGAFTAGLREQLRNLDLGQNPFVCSCDLVWFRHWYLWSDRSVFNKTDAHYTCFDKDENRKLTFQAFHMSQQACLLSPEVNNNIIFANAFLVTTMTAFLLLYSYRWHLRLFLYEAFRGRDDARRRYLQQGNFKYDIFVSYASENLPWVRRNLMAELEERLGLRLCIHERDFIPGQNIVDNISECVESSKKVMMLFSRHFKRSPWCQFELAFCLTHVMDHDDALIIVSLDDLTSYELTSTMMAVLKTTTYIQWNRHPDAVRSFWGRLQQALHEIMQPEQPL